MQSRFEQLDELGQSLSAILDRLSTAMDWAIFSRPPASPSTPPAEAIAAHWASIVSDVNYSEGTLQSLPVYARPHSEKVVVLAGQYPGDFEAISETSCCTALITYIRRLTAALSHDGLMVLLSQIRWAVDTDKLKAGIQQEIIECGKALRAAEDEHSRSNPTIATSRPEDSGRATEISVAWLAAEFAAGRFSFRFAALHSVLREHGTGFGIIAGMPLRLIRDGLIAVVDSDPDSVKFNCGGRYNILSAVELAQTDTAQTPDLAPLRPVVTLNPPQIVIDENAYALSHDAAEYLETLIEQDDWMSDTDYKSLRPTVGENFRFDRLKGIPDAVQKRIKTDRRKGKRWMS